MCSGQCIVMGFAVGTLFLQQSRGNVEDAQVCFKTANVLLWWKSMLGRGMQQGQGCDNVASTRTGVWLLSMLALPGGG